ncbi:MAG: hypothetical protein PHE33_06880 [Bacteroidales bacterium]|nr:hypothetical protein [Bacteroidales bacterium]
MATIIIEYDARNKIAKKTIEYILSLGVFKVKKKMSGIDEALLDVKEGRVYKAENTDDMFKKILG